MLVKQIRVGQAVTKECQRWGEETKTGSQSQETQRKSHTKIRQEMETRKTKQTKTLGKYQ